MRRYNGRCPVKILFYLLLTLLSHLFAHVTASLRNGQHFFRVQNITFLPPYLHKLREGAAENVKILLSLEPFPPPNYSDWAPNNAGGHYYSTPGPNNNVNDNPNGSTIFVCYQPEDPAIAWLPDNQKCSTIDLPFTEVDNKNAPEESNGSNDTAMTSSTDTAAASPLIFLNSTFTVQGLFIGKTRINVKVYARPPNFDDNNNNGDDDDVIAVAAANPVKRNRLGGHNVKGDNAAVSGTVDRSLVSRTWFETSVVRDNSRMQHIFVGTLTVLLIVANVLMGAQLNLDVVLDVLKKPVAPLICFACQYLFMPLISFLLASLIFLPVGLTTLGLGMFTAGCSPGGGASNGYTLCLDGNVDLSVTMTFVSTVAALVMMPLWMFALGRHFLTSTPGQPTNDIHIPYKNITYSLIVLVFPLIAGVLIRKYHNKAHEKANRILRPFFILIIAFICTFGVYINFYMFRLMTWRVLLAGMALPWSGFLFGSAASLITKQPLANLKAIAIETGIQNTGISIILLQLSFDQPDADLAAVVPVVVAMFTPPPLVTALIVHYALKWRREKREKRLKSADQSAAFENGPLNNDDVISNQSANSSLASRYPLNGGQAVHQSDSTKPLYPMSFDSNEKL